MSLVTIKLPINAGIFEPGRKVKSGRHVLGISINLSEVWSQLRDAQAVGASIFSQSEDAIYLKDTNCRYVQVNQPFCKLVGKEAKEIIGKLASEIWTTNPELIKEMEDQDQAVLAGNAQLLKARRTRLPDGTFQLRSTCKTLINDVRGNPWRILGISRDVSWLELDRYVDPDVRPQMGSAPPSIKERQVTVMFCDIRKFSALAQSLARNSDVLIDLLSQFFEKVVELAREHGCVFDKLIGDGAMLLVGAVDYPGRTEREDAKRAAEFALSLKKAFADIVEFWHQRHRHVLIQRRELRLGIGIHMGPAMSGFLQNQNRVEFSAFGETVNLGQRFENGAARGSGDILISHPVHEAILDWFEMSEMKEVPTKDGCIFAYELIRKRVEN